MLPGPVLVMLRVLAWLSLPLWPADVSAAFVLDDNGVVILTGAAMVATFCALSLHTHNRMDDRLARGLAAQRRSEAEIALLAGAMVDSGMVAVAPILRTSGGIPVLRSVPDCPAS